MAELKLSDDEKHSETLLTWSDETLGKAVKATAFVLDDKHGKDALIWTTAACLIIKKMLAAGSDSTSITLDGVTLPEEVGNWRVTIEQIPPAFGHASDLSRAEKLRDQIRKTWNPPLKGMGRPSDVAQTAIMQALAYVFGTVFIGQLTEAQDKAITDGTALMKQTLEPCSCRKCLAGKMEDGLPVTARRMILCATCGNKRCPHATDHELPCTGSNDTGQPGAVYA